MKILSDEMNFKLSSHASRHNFVYWDVTYPHITIETLNQHGLSMIKSSPAISRVRCTLYTDVSMSISVIIIRVDVWICLPWSLI